jgi:hypothetical protein
MKWATNYKRTAYYRSFAAERLRKERRLYATIALLSCIYSVTLAILERRLPIIPDYTIVEVMVGVLIVLVPAALIARRLDDDAFPLTWRRYERLIVGGFVSSGIPIAVWQAVEYILRRA